ncbi:cytochrome P450 CYP12A2-like [Episyrphus balteatus]|uniref:cytochrome P450 CYP12A2-like n=1 Tax=Episyrphus balteatus TaxID=286459 RepID=UPI0024857EC5|nr:cytochrome P450 CYP12A2-like [Episyrphus balteatus]
MFQPVRVINCSLRTCQWNQLRSVAQVNLKNNEEIHEKGYSQEWLNAKPTNEIPGPTVYNMIRGFMPGGEYYKMSLNDFTLAGRKKYGDIFMLPAMLGRSSMLMVFNPNDFPVFLHSEGIWPLRNGLETMNYHRTIHKKEDYGDVIGLLGSNGEAWGKIRTAVNPILMKSQNSRLYLGKMQAVSSEFLERIREIRDPTTMEVPDNFLDEINRLTFESVAVIALDQEIGLIRKNRDHEDAQAIFSSLRSIFDLTLDLDVNPSLWRFISTPKFKQMMKSYDTLHEIIMKLINQALERIEMEKSISKDDQEKSVLEKLLKIDKRVAVVMALDMLMAGVDTTSTTLTGNLLCLAKNPEKQMKLRKEIRSVLPQKDSLLTIDSLKNLPYLRACIKEGIRMYPISSGFPRIASDNIVMSGYRVPRNQEVLLNSNLVLMEDEHIPNAKHYLPERWLRSEKATTKDQINPFIYIPFGFGARSCVGKRIVEMELETTIARLVRNFHIEFNYSTEKAFKNRLINTPAIPLKFKFSEVEN